RLHRGAARRVEEAGLPHARLHRLHRHRRADHAGRWLFEVEVSLFGDARLPDRFWEKVLDHPASGCWEWQAARDQKGYGRFRWKGFTRRAHRVAYEELVAPVPDGLQLDHLCRNPFCCAPWHLEPVTPRENTLRGESIQ